MTDLTGPQPIEVTPITDPESQKINTDIRMLSIGSQKESAKLPIQVPAPIQQEMALSPSSGEAYSNKNSETLEKFSGNTYFGTPACPPLKHSMALFSTVSEFVKRVNYQDFTLTNYHRTFRTRSKLLNSVIDKYSQTILERIATYNTVIDPLLDTIEAWGKTTKSIIMSHGTDNEAYKKLSSFRKQIKIERTQLEKLLTDCRFRCLASQKKFETTGVFFNLLAVQSQAFKNYAKAHSELINYLHEPEHLEYMLTVINGGLLDRQKNLFLLEFKLASYMYHYEVEIRNEQLELQQAYTSIVSRVQFLGLQASEVVKELQQLIKVSPLLQADDIILGFGAINNLKSVSETMPLTPRDCFNEPLALFIRKAAEPKDAPAGPVTVSSKLSQETKVVQNFFKNYCLRYAKLSGFILLSTPARLKYPEGPVVLVIDVSIHL